ncbi:MAG: glycosyltransferase [Lachnospiraceae bacterium]|nr:glycosyltransferase [Lachnospiraceae bacterium]
MSDTQKKPAVSVIMPCYNTEKYLKKTMDSLFAQTFSDFELIMVDDGSTDKTPELLDSYKSRYPDVITVVHRENGGQSSARNLALDMAAGEYILFWDSDDYAELDYMEALVSAARANDSDAVISGSHYIDENGVVIENLNYPVDRFPDYPLRRLSPHGKLYRRDFLNRHGIRFAPGKLYEDNPFNFKAMFLARNPVILPVTRHYQVVHPGSSMASRLTSDKVPFDAIEDALSYVNEHSSEINDRNVYEFTVLSFITYFIFLGNREHMQAALHKYRGCKYSPELIRELCIFAQRVIPQKLPDYGKNPYVGIFRGRELQLRHRLGVWLFVRLLKTHTLYPFARVYYFFVR